MKILIKKLLSKDFRIHIYVTIGFILASVLFYHPLLQGKKLFQSDIAQYEGMSREIKENREKFDKEIYWIDNAFGGMPTYQLGAKYPYDILAPLHYLFRFIPRPAHTLFLYLISMYILLLVFKVPWKISLIGSLAFGLSTYLLIILQVGHNTKALAISYIPLVISGLVLLKQNKKILGFILSLIALALQIRANHYQMTYYLLFIIALFFIVYLIDSYKKGEMKMFVKSISPFFLAGILALGLNGPNLLSTYEYSKYSTRSSSELKLNADGTEKEKSSGLDYDYITQYSYGIFESLNTIIPRIQGGGSREDIGEKSNLYKFLVDNNVPKNQASSFVKGVPTYWGDQPILEAPAYIGITVFFLFILSLFMIRGPTKIWLVSCIILSLLLSWGKNFPLLTNFFIENFPMYNKFRAVSSIQVILEFAIPLLASIGLYNYIKEGELKYLNKTFLIIVIPLTILLLIKSSISFIGPNDQYYKSIFGDQIVNQIIYERANMYSVDIIRAIIFSFIMYCILRFKHLFGITILSGLVGGFVLADLITVNNRYLDRELFINEDQTFFSINESNQEIIKDKSDYRVYDTSQGINGAKTSFFHNSIGGYHAAKLRRFQEAYDYFSFHNNNVMINMLNTKYIVYESETDKDLFVNEDALGNVWAVDSISLVNSADEILDKLTKVDIEKHAITFKDSYSPDNLNQFNSNDLIEINFNRNSSKHITYKYNATSSQLLVFSEIYYPKGWSVFIDDKRSEYFDVNYILRGMVVPEGKHKIDFYFEPEIVKLGINVRLISIILTFSFIGYMFYKKDKR
ncbi:MAG: YfhO family protein [Candidatus Marisimplicoccus sp.]